MSRGAVVGRSRPAASDGTAAVRAGLALSVAGLLTAAVAALLLRSALAGPPPSVAEPAVTPPASDVVLEGSAAGRDG